MENKTLTKAELHFFQIMDGLGIQRPTDIGEETGESPEVCQEIFDHYQEIKARFLEAVEIV